jgi:hypothetical protein
MGTLVEMTTNHWVVRSGGKPHADWSGLAEPCEMDSLMQLRPTSIADSQKAFKHRATGLSDKYDEASDLSYFADELWRHMLTTGLDTIAYLPDPETGEMMSVILHHTRFTLEKASTLAQPQVLLYDAVDKNNNSAAIECLLDSVSPGPISRSAFATVL